MQIGTIMLDKKTLLTNLISFSVELFYISLLIGTIYYLFFVPLAFLYGKVCLYLVCHFETSTTIDYFKKLNNTTLLFFLFLFLLLMLDQTKKRITNFGLLHTGKFDFKKVNLWYAKQYLLAMGFTILFLVLPVLLNILISFLFTLFFVRMGYLIIPAATPKLVWVISILCAILAITIFMISLIRIDKKYWNVASM